MSKNWAKFCWSSENQCITSWLGLLFVASVALWAGFNVVTFSTEIQESIEYTVEKSA